MVDQLRFHSQYVLQSGRLKPKAKIDIVKGDRKGRLV
jgi:hypothetical protein